MVAITVILAAVIGAFVLEIGDQQETAPSTSFDSEQTTRFLIDDIAINSGGGNCRANGNQHCANVTQVEIAHAGGSVVPIDQAQITVEGNTSVWGVQKPGGQNGANLLVAPRPDVRQTFGTNERATFDSGQSWDVFTRMGTSEPAGAWNPNVAIADEHLQNKDYRARFFMDGDPVVRIRELNSDSLRSVGFGYFLETGNSVNVVWTASSGGKTQTLFKYRVQ
jgi:hypothetical protein